MKILNEVRKEDDMYYQGAFWIIEDNFTDILRGNFTLDGVVLPSNYEDEYLDNKLVKSDLTHQSLWNREFSKKYKEGLEYDYYPRGRVGIYEGKAYVNIPSKCNTPDVINEIIEMYSIEKLELILNLIDERKPHYRFGLK